MLANRWTVLGLLLLIRIAMGVQFQAVTAVAPLLVGEMALDHADVGTLVGFYLLPGLVIAIPGGIFGSRFPDRTMVAVGVVLMALGGFVAGFAGGYAGIAAGRLISGAGAVIQGIFVVKLISDWFDGREVVTALAIMLSGFPVGIALALPVLGALANVAGWPVTMHLGGVLCLASLAILLVFYRPPPGRAAQGGRSSFWLPRRQLLLVGTGSLLWGFYNVAYFAFLTFGPALLIEHGMAMIDAGLAISVSSWVTMAAVPLGGILAERSGRPGLVLVVGCIAAGLCMAALPLIDWPYLLSAGIGAFAAAPAGIVMAAVTGVVSPQYRAQANGIIYTVFYGGIGLCPALAGWLADAAGTAAAPIYLCAAILLVTAALYPLYVLATARWRAPQPA